MALDRFYFDKVGELYGLIGNAVLRQYNVVFDHSRSRMYLESPVKK